jgi:hypothetical protein
MLCHLSRGGLCRRRSFSGRTFADVALPGVQAGVADAKGKSRPLIKLRWTQSTKAGRSLAAFHIFRGCAFQGLRLFRVSLFPRLSALSVIARVPGVIPLR